MPYIETPDEIPIYYLDEGPRTNSGIFLIHAEPFNSKFWQKNISDLARSFRVVSMDVRGRGESEKTDDGQNIPSTHVTSDTCWSHLVYRGLWW